MDEGVLKMDYTEILSALKSANLFDLYRLQVAIQNEMEDPEKIAVLRKMIRLGACISYFDRTQNRLVEARVLEKNQKKLRVQNLCDQTIWNIPYYFVNLENKKTDIRETKLKMCKNTLKVGDQICFETEEEQIYGFVTRLNQKTATIQAHNNRIWRVSYNLLNKVIDGEAANIIDIIKISAPRGG
jgi:hypothetical protein